MQYINGETASIILFFIGLYGLIARRNIVKTVISIGIMEAGVILFFISLNFKDGALPPIGDTSPELMADPLPQALMITAIVIGVSVTAVSLTMFITLYHKFGSTNWLKVYKKRIDEAND
ncbi:cation:proton antiporter subunit C [Herbivorax sp. ANBcel31]|uniref:sodium:proton antiporter n=1 Tax=Herbivorax sp. ANBcel31 TaxID=3069754 RepID=UPI0027B73A7D|nr:cation:proton antiporter subunit C [Herbivorax sp. ANBcel31]MDQ2086164.1 cation:proton antiporter subunit C [Herbivorax sp. ANBcel31]